MLLIVLLIFATLSACSPTPTTAPAPVAAEPTPPRVGATTEATSKAEALAAEIAAREAEYQKSAAEIAKRDRATPLPANAPAPTPSAVQTNAAPAASSSSPVVSAAPSPVSTSANTRDEPWWKNEMRTVEVRLTDDTRRLQEARNQRDMAQRQMGLAVDAGATVFAQAQEAFNRASAEVLRLEAEVRNDSAAVERVREDARRAGVPPGWLRWP